MTRRPGQGESLQPLGVLQGLARRRARAGRPRAAAGAGERQRDGGRRRRRGGRGGDRRALAAGRRRDLRSARRQGAGGERRGTAPAPGGRRARHRVGDGDPLPARDGAARARPRSGGQARAALEEQGLPASRAPEALAVVAAVQASEIWRRAAAAERLLVEVPFEICLHPGDPLLPAGGEGRARAPRSRFSSAASSTSPSARRPAGSSSTGRPMPSAPRPNWPSGCATTPRRSASTRTSGPGSPASRSPGAGLFFTAANRYEAL